MKVGDRVRIVKNRIVLSFLVGESALIADVLSSNIYGLGRYRIITENRGISQIAYEEELELISKEERLTGFAKWRSKNENRFL